MNEYLVMRGSAYWNTDRRLRVADRSGIRRGKMTEDDDVGFRIITEEQTCIKSPKEEAATESRIR